jgi:hypothetical protein
MQKKLLLILVIIFLTPAVSFADDCIEGDCVNGKGTMVYATGHRYTGGFKDGVRHGEGILLMPGKRKMEGVWLENEIRQGKFTGSDGTVYEGQWEFRERNGQGTLIYPDGRKYVGEFKDGQRHGRGTMTWPDGRTYVGDYTHGTRTGHGTMTYPDGKVVKGEFKDGQIVE